MSPSILAARRCDIWRFPTATGTNIGMHNMHVYPASRLMCINTHRSRAGRTHWPSTYGIDGPVLGQWVRPICLCTPQPTSRKTRMPNFVDIFSMTSCSHQSFICFHIKYFQSRTYVNATNNCGKVYCKVHEKTTGANDVAYTNVWWHVLFSIKHWVYEQSGSCEISQSEEIARQMKIGNKHKLWILMIPSIRHIEDITSNRK